MKKSTHILSVEVNQLSQIEHNCITSTQVKKRKISNIPEDFWYYVLSHYTPKVNISWILKAKISLPLLGLNNNKIIWCVTILFWASFVQHSFFENYIVLCSCKPPLLLYVIACVKTPQFIPSTIDLHLGNFYLELFQIILL